jgi:hypothetical protein
MFGIASIGAMLAGKLGKYLIAGGIGVAVVGGIWLHGYAKGRENGAARIQRQWDNAKGAERKAGEQARKRAESTVRSGGVRPNDPYNRIR